MKAQPDIAHEAARQRRTVLVASGDVHAARDELNHAISEQPDNVELLEERCRLLFEHFTPDEAEAGFRALLEHDPQNAAGHHNLGSIEYKLGRFDQAANAYRRSIQLRPNSASTHLHLGYALREAGRIDDAIAAWRHALEIEPSDALAAKALNDVN